MALAVQLMDNKGVPSGPLSFQIVNLEISDQYKTLGHAEMGPPEGVQPTFSPNTAQMCNYSDNFEAKM